MNGNEPLIITKDSIIIDPSYSDKSKAGSVVMHSCELSLMKAMADLTTRNGGDILEIGFGLGISASYIQQNKIKSHTIIEVHPEIYERACKWADEQDVPVHVYHGDWVDVLPTLETTYDGVFHDTHLDNQVHNFLPIVKHTCKKNTAVVFFSHFFLLDVPKYEQLCKVGKLSYEEFNSCLKNTEPFSIHKHIFTDEELIELQKPSTYSFVLDDDRKFDIYYTVFDGNQFVKDIL